MTADEVIALLDLKPLPIEGGFYRETYRNPEMLSRGSGQRSLCTAIYYLLTPTTRSALHRLPGDEIYHFYLGDPVEMLLLGPGDKSRALVLGPNLAAGEMLQTVVPAGVWQGSLLVAGGRFALMGTTMSPGFDFADYEPGTRQLISRWPQWRERIERLAPEEATRRGAGR